MTGVRVTLGRQRLGRGVEWQFAQLSIPREFSRSVVAQLLTDRAEYGGWELDRLRVGTDGVRRVVLRRKIIRQARPVSSGLTPLG
jgi:hypothetical protein